MTWAWINDHLAVLRIDVKLRRSVLRGDASPYHEKHIALVNFQAIFVPAIGDFETPHIHLDVFFSSHVRQCQLDATAERHVSVSHADRVTCDTGSHPAVDLNNEQVLTGNNVNYLRQVELCGARLLPAHWMRLKILRIRHKLLHLRLQLEDQTEVVPDRREFLVGCRNLCP